MIILVPTRTSVKMPQEISCTPTGQEGEAMCPLQHTQPKRFGSCLFVAYMIFSMGSEDIVSDFLKIYFREILVVWLLELLCSCILTVMQNLNMITVVY